MKVRVPPKTDFTSVRLATELPVYTARAGDAQQALVLAVRESTPVAVNTYQALPTIASPPGVTGSPGSVVAAVMSAGPANRSAPTAVGPPKSPLGGGGISFPLRREGGRT